MKLNKAVVARVVASIINGASPEEFAWHADRDLPYRLADGACLYVIGRREKEVPIARFADLAYSQMLILALPYDAISIRTLPALWLMDIARGHSASSMSGVAYNCHIILVSDIGRDSFTHQVKYGVIRFSSTADLLSAVDKQVASESEGHLKEVWRSYLWNGGLGSRATRLCNAYISGALKVRLMRSPDTRVTLPG